MNDGPIVRRISFDIHGEFITQLAREWFYTGEKSHEKVIEILMDSMTGTDTPEAQIRRYAEDILLGRAALKGRHGSRYISSRNIRTGRRRADAARA